MQIKESIINILNDKDIDFLKELIQEKEEYIESACQFVGQKILQNKNVLYSDSFSIIYYICVTSKFSTKSECYKVAQIIYNFCNIIDPFPLFSEHTENDLAERIFVCLCFYKCQMHTRHLYKGYPSIDFYRHICQTIFIKNNNKDLANNLSKWESFIQERFI